LAIKAGRFYTKKEYEEIKLRASMKSVFSQVFTPRKKVKFAMEGTTAGVQAVDLEASSKIRTLLKPRQSVSEGTAHSLTEQEWEAVCMYVQLLSTRLPELQETLFTSKTALSERLMGVEDELGAALVDLGTGEGIPGGGYVNMWSGIGAALEDNQAVAHLVSKCHQQFKVNAGNIGAAMAKANQANLEATTLITQLVGMYQTQRAEEEKLAQVNGQLYQLTLIMNQTQQDFQQHNLTSQQLPSGGGPVMGPVMVNDVPVEDDVAQLRLEIQVAQSCLRSDPASIAGHVFESYEDTLAWVVAHFSPEDWQYAMDMPALYILIRPVGQQHDVMLQEESNSSKAGYASSLQARLSLSFKMKVPGFFGADRSAKNGHPFSAISDFSKW
jgi:hypothetical protein